MFLNCYSISINLFGRDQDTNKRPNTCITVVSSCLLACERRLIFVAFIGGEKRQPEIRLCSQTSCSLVVCDMLCCAALTCYGEGEQDVAAAISR